MYQSGLPQEHLELIAELQEMERQFNEANPLFPPAIVAKAFTCLAHDWVQIGFEEHCHRLLLKADSIFPGYHGLQMQQDMQEDPIFARLVHSLTSELALVVLSTARDNK